MDRRGEELEDRLLEFAARVGKLVDALPETRLAPLLDEASQLCNIVAKSIVTAKSNPDEDKRMESGRFGKTAPH